MSTIKTRGTIRLDVDACKGCELCIPACPPAVLEMSTARNELGVHYPELSPGCTGCGACLLPPYASVRLRLTARWAEGPACEEPPYAFARLRLAARRDKVAPCGACARGCPASEAKRSAQRGEAERRRAPATARGR